MKMFYPLLIVASLLWSHAVQSAEPRHPLVVSLATPGYEFDLIQSAAGASVSVVVDPAQPVIVPLATTHSAARRISPEPLTPIVPSFQATFCLVNSTRVPRTFEFPWQYWADNKIVFTVFDSTGATLWRSVPLPVDQPPLAKPVDLTLAPHHAWRQTTAIPLQIGGVLLADGQYRLEAALTGSPAFSANATFLIKNVVSGPIIDPVPGTGIKGLAQVGPVSPVERPGVPNVQPLPGAIIQVDQVRIIGVFYIHPLFSGQAVADEHGVFSIVTPPGQFTVTGLPPTPGATLPRGSTQTVTVEAGHYRQIVVNYDSGIR